MATPVQGKASPGKPATGSPVVVAGVTATGKVQPILVAADGTIQVST